MPTSLHPYGVVALLRAQKRNKNASTCCKCLSNQHKIFFRKSGRAVFLLRVCARKSATKASPVGPAGSARQGGSCGRNCSGATVFPTHCALSPAVPPCGEPRKAEARRSLGSPDPARLSRPQPGFAAVCPRVHALSLPTSFLRPGGANVSSPGQARIPNATCCVWGASAALGTGPGGFASRRDCRRHFHGGPLRGAIPPDDFPQGTPFGRPWATDAGPLRGRGKCG